MEVLSSLQMKMSLNSTLSKQNNKNTQRESSCSCNFHYLPVNKVEVRENYVGEVYEPMFMQMCHHLQDVVFFKGEGKLQRDYAENEWVISLNRDKQRASVQWQRLQLQMLSLMIQVNRRMQMVHFSHISYFVLL